MLTRHVSYDIRQEAIILLHFVVNFSIKEITAELSALEQVKLQSTTMYFVLLN
jgi:hypothetical protein